MIIHNPTTITGILLFRNADARMATIAPVMAQNQIGNIVTTENASRLSVKQTTINTCNNKEKTSAAQPTQRNAEMTKSIHLCCLESATNSIACAVVAGKQIPVLEGVLSFIALSNI